MKYVFKLFVNGRGSRSIEAFRRVKDVCDERLPGQYQLWVVNVLLQPDLVDEDVDATPTLVRYSPEPRRQVISDFSDPDRMLEALGVSNGRLAHADGGAAFGRPVAANRYH